VVGFKLWWGENFLRCQELLFVGMIYFCWGGWDFDIRGEWNCIDEMVGLLEVS